MAAPILNLADGVLQPRPPEYLPPSTVAQRIEARQGRVGPLPGLQKLGGGLVLVAPGKQALLLHSHRHNDAWHGEQLAGRPTHAAR